MTEATATAGTSRRDVERDLTDDNARLQATLLERVPMLTAAQLDLAAGRDGISQAAGWKRTGRVMSVPYDDVDLFPAAQFDDAGQPLPAMRLVLAALPAGVAAWPRLAWFASGNGWLGGRTPFEALQDADAVVAAARHLAEPAIG